MEVDGKGVERVGKALTMKVDTEEVEYIVVNEDLVPEEKGRGRGEEKKVNKPYGNPAARSLNALTRAVRLFISTPQQRRRRRLATTETFGIQQHGMDTFVDTHCFWYMK